MRGEGGDVIELKTTVSTTYLQSVQLAVHSVGKGLHRSPHSLLTHLRK